MYHLCEINDPSLPTILYFVQRTDVIARSKLAAKKSDLFPLRLREPITFLPWDSKVILKFNESTHPEFFI